MARLIAGISGLFDGVAGTRTLAARAALAIAALGLPGVPGLSGLSGVREVRGQCQYEITAMIQGDPCGSFGQGNTTVRDLSENGEVVGSYVCGLSDAVPFYWSQETGFVILDIPDWFSGASSARGISDEGTIVGSFTKEIVGTRAFHYKDGVWTELPPVDPESGWSRAQAVSPDGRYVVGWRSITSEINPFNAFIWDAKTGEFTDLGVMNGPFSEAHDVNSNGWVVGYTGSYAGIERGDSPFIYANGRLDIPGPIPGTLNSSAGSVNAAGLVFCTGRVSFDPQAGVCALYQRGTWTMLPNLAGYDWSGGGDLNDEGIAAGTSTISAAGLPTPRATLWLGDQVYDLNDLIPPDTGLDLKGGSAINNGGQILCSAYDGNGSVGVLLTPIYPLGDIDADCQVSLTDLQLLLIEWGPASASQADFDGDGVVGPSDLATLLANWSKPM